MKKLNKKDVWNLIQLGMLEMGFPEGCKWVAVDSRGPVYGFSVKPVPETKNGGLWMGPDNEGWDVFELYETRDES